LKPEIIIQYIKLNGGFFSFFSVVLGSFLLYAAMQTMGSIYIEKWSNTNGTEDHYLYLYMAFIIGSTIFVFINVCVLVISSIQQGREVHSSIIKRVLYSSYTNFFNRVPIGRILNRLGRDVKEIDEVVGTSLRSSLLYFVQILSALALIIYSSTYLAFISFVCIFAICFFIRKYYVSALHQITRLEKITNSPVVSGFTTVVGGLTTVRAYKQENYFLEMQAQYLDENKKMLLNKYGLEAWFELMLMCIIFGLNAFCIGYGMFSSTSTSSSFGLLLLSLLNIN
jgi:ABC-type multidrug transport system fused ATPase/permease subunit